MVGVSSLGMVLMGMFMRVRNEGPGPWHDEGTCTYPPSLQ